MATEASEPLTSIVVSQTSGSNYTDIDNFSYSTVPVPEPMTFILGIAGIFRLGLVALRKKFRRA